MDNIFFLAMLDFTQNVTEIITVRLTFAVQKRQPLITGMTVYAIGLKEVSVVKG